MSNLIYDFIDGGSMDWQRVENYLCEHGLEVPDSEDCEIGGEFKFNILVSRIFDLAIDKTLGFFSDVLSYEQQEELGQELKDNIFCNYLDSFINVDLEEFAEKHELDAIDKDIKNRLEDIKSL